MTSHPSDAPPHAPTSAPPQPSSNSHSRSQSEQTTTSTDADAHDPQTTSTGQAQQSGGSSGDAGDDARGLGGAGGFQGERGLKKLSVSVLNAVKSRGHTSYGDVAAALIRELTGSEPSADAVVESKNVRRRVYDILNVLVAMGIVGKRGKVIQWNGIQGADGLMAPTSASAITSSSAAGLSGAAGTEGSGSSSSATHQHSSSSSTPFHSTSHPQHSHSHPTSTTRSSEIEQLREKLEAKRQELIELYRTHMYLLGLAEYNRLRAPNVPMEERIKVPFMVLSAPSDARIECELSEDSRQVLFRFNTPFEVRDDWQVIDHVLRDVDLAKFHEQVVPEQFREWIPASDLLKRRASGSGSASASASGHTTVAFDEPA